MMNILNNRVRGGGRRHNNANHRLLLRDDDDDDDEERVDNDKNNDNHHKSQGKDDDDHRQSTTAIAKKSRKRGGKGATAAAGGSRRDRAAARIVHSSTAASSLSTATVATSCTDTTATSLLSKLKTKKSVGQDGRRKGRGGVATRMDQERQPRSNRRYLCSFEDDYDDDQQDRRNITENGSISFPSIGYDDDETKTRNPSFPSQSHRTYGRPTTRIIRTSGSANNYHGGLNNYSNRHAAGLTRVVLSTKQGQRRQTNNTSPATGDGGARKVLQRDVRTRGRMTFYTDVTASPPSEEEEAEIMGGSEKLRRKADETEKQINDNICVYQYAEDDQSVELAAEIIYASVSFSTLAAEEEEIKESDCTTVRERKFSLFYEAEEDDHEESGHGMMGGGCSILDLIGIGGRKADAKSEKGGETSSQRRMRQRQEHLHNLGKNGWHRALPEMVLDDVPSPPPTVASAAGIVAPTIVTNSNGTDASSSFPCLDRLSVAHILQNSQPTLDEYSAIHDEHNRLLKEIECLEKDRVQLELLFYGAVEDAEEERKFVASTGGGGEGSSLYRSRAHPPNNQAKVNAEMDNPTKRMVYQTFRTSLNRMTRSCQKVDQEILNSPVPVMWLVEDILPLMATESYDGDMKQFNNDTTVSTKSQSRKRQIFHSFSSSNADDEPNFEDRMRNFRGDGIALLIADPQSRITLVDKCCSQFVPKKNKKQSFGIGSTSFASTGISSCYSSSYAPPATCSSSVTNLSIDPTSLDMLALMKLKSEGDEENETRTFDDRYDDDADTNDDEIDDDDPSAAILIDEGGSYLTHCAITGGWGGSAPSSAAVKDGNGQQDDRTVSSSYFFKFDNGEIFHGGGIRNSLPSNLVLRLVREGRDPSTIKYLSTGPLFSWKGGGGTLGAGYNTNNRCYYAEFDDGECWWGTNNDDVLDRIFMNMDVHRVAFGSSSSESYGEAEGAGFATSPSDVTVGKSLSFVVIGKDGSVKWKNIPRGLQNALVLHKSNGADNNVMSRVSRTTSPISSDENDHTAAVAAPCEVSLGMDGSYFVRFLDGTVDYVLPNFAADVVDTLEGCGKHIRNVALHVDTYDCLIRYSS